MGIAQWMRAADALTSLAQLAGPFRVKAPPEQTSPSPAGAISQLGDQLETRLTGVVVAALKEAFDRDRARMELERAQLEADRQRAERALAAELRRQAIDRALDQIRVVAVMTLAAWMVSAILSAWMPGMHGAGARVALGVGWLCGFASLAAAFSAWRAIGVNVPEVSRDAPAGPALAITVASWLLLVMLACCATAILFAL